MILIKKLAKINSQDTKEQEEKCVSNWKTIMKILILYSA